MEQEKTESFERFHIDLDAYFHQIQTGPCFICGIVARDPNFPAHIIYEDENAIAFLDKYPPQYGHTLVAPREHREQVTGDFTVEEYLNLQIVVYRVAEAIRQELCAERVYLLSFGSKQGISHVHWHISPLPPGVPFREQQLAVFRKGVLKIPEEEKATFVKRIQQKLQEVDKKISASW